MNPPVRWGIIAATVAGVVVLFVLLRPDAATEDDTSPTPSTPTPTVTPSETGSPSPTPSPEPARTLIEVTVRNGNVQVRARPTATQGDGVRIVVRADVSDHVHLHGYDLMADVAPGQPATIDFVAAAAGVFECELEDADKLLFRLEIVP